MRFGVSRQALVFIAGAVWIVAGANILRIGVLTWQTLPSCEWYRFAEAFAVFLVFFLFVFRRLFRKHTRRIEQKGESSCPFSFFDAKGWIVMTVMIAFGILGRKFHWLPNPFIAVFYVGLSAALILTGLLFLIYGWRRRSYGAKS